MTLNINFSQNNTNNYDNYIIVISSLNELNDFKSLEIDLKKLGSYLKNEISSKKSKNIDFGLFLFDNGKKIKTIKVIYLNQKNDQEATLQGVNLYNYLKLNSQKKHVMNFSKKILSKNNYTCCSFLFGLINKSYVFNKYKSDQSSKQITILIPNSEKTFKKFNYFKNLNYAINFCKDLVSEPANILNPINYANRCDKLRKIGLKIKIFDKSQLTKIGMGSLLGVSKGSTNDPRVVVFEWKCKKKSKPTILVGKGITFDTGGISLKPASGMEEMITDMSGSAVVVGSMINAALNKINKPIVGIVGLVENMPDGDSQRPGDIVKSLSGKTIEVLNTDAEGRLILCDMLTYVQQKYNPKEIIDFATLTGAIMVALGKHKAGLFSNNDNLSLRLFNSGEKVSERLWRLPLGPEYDKDMDSNRADINNIGKSRYGGSITAAQFLQRFIENKTPWAHLDIAGVSWNSNNKLHGTGATAFGVRLISQFLSK